jgi:hypothetical protein
MVAALLVLGAAVHAGATQESDAGGVHVAVTPGRIDAQGPFWEFAVSFHSRGPVLRDDLMCIASLVVDGAVEAPAGWQELAPREAHHRAGVLRFLAAPWTPRQIELRLRRDGESEARLFRWDMSGWFALQLPARFALAAAPAAAGQCATDPEDWP